MNEHLHFEVIRLKGIAGLNWYATGRTNVGSGLHRVDPLPYLNGRSINLGKVEEDTYSELLRTNPLATSYDFMKFAEDNNTARR